MSLALSPQAQRLLFVDARSARSFTDEPVSDELVREVYDLVKYAPTALNAQPLRLVLVRGEAKERLLPHLAEGNRAKSASAPVVAVVAVDVDFHERFPETAPHAPGMRERFAEDEPGREELAVRNGFLQLGYLLLGVRAAGLAAGPMTGIDTAGLEKEFFDARHRVLAVVNIGHPAPDAWRDRAPRLGYDEVVRAA